MEIYVIVKLNWTSYVRYDIDRMYVHSISSAVSHTGLVVKCLLMPAGYHSSFFSTILNSGGQSVILSRSVFQLIFSVVHVGYSKVKIFCCCVPQKWCNVGSVSYIHSCRWECVTGKQWEVVVAKKLSDTYTSTQLSVSIDSQMTCMCDLKLQLHHS